MGLTFKKSAHVENLTCVKSDHSFIFSRIDDGHKMSDKIVLPTTFYFHHLARYNSHDVGRHS